MFRRFRVPVFLSVFCGFHIGIGWLKCCHLYCLSTLSDGDRISVMCCSVIHQVAPRTKWTTLALSVTSTCTQTHWYTSGQLHATRKGMFLTNANISGDTWHVIARQWMIVVYVSYAWTHAFLCMFACACAPVRACVRLCQVLAYLRVCWCRICSSCIFTCTKVQKLTTRAIKKYLTILKEIRSTHCAR